MTFDYGPQKASPKSIRQIEAQVRQIKEELMQAAQPERAMLEFGLIDRSGWSSGPWDSEPDKIRWTDQITGLDCLIVRQRPGHLCGYVGVEPEHRLYKVNYSNNVFINDIEL